MILIESKTLFSIWYQLNLEEYVRFMSNKERKYIVVQRNGMCKDMKEQKSIAYWGSSKHFNIATAQNLLRKK